MFYKRPVDLNLFKVRFPITAIVSGLHRISGLFLFLLMPLALWALQQSLATESDWESLHLLIQSNSIKLSLWLGLSALGYHVLAGLRHMMMDYGFGDSLRAGRFGAYLVLCLSILIALILGVWLWL